MKTLNFNIILALIVSVATIANAESNPTIINTQKDIISDYILCDSAEHVLKSFASLPLNMAPSGRIEAISNAGSFNRLWDKRTKEKFQDKEIFQSAGENLKKSVTDFLRLAVNGIKGGSGSYTNEPLRFAVVSSAEEFLKECKVRITIESNGQ